MNDLKTLRQLIKMMVDNDLTEIDLEGEGEKVKLKRGVHGVPMVQAQAIAPQLAPAVAAGAPQATAGDAGANEPADDGLPTIDCPMVGSFYSASSPDADAFIKVGDRVTPDTVVCIVEAMKVFNEIKAEISGTVTEILVSSGDAVEFGQPLFKVKP
ncbi:MAG: acetyl-CoA carboxylase biotin carboxyl carrier protein [Algisphaera sp.]